MNARRIPGAFAVGLLLAVAAVAAQHTPARAAEKGKPALPGGELRILDAQGQAVGACPLKHTDVQADIVGYVGRVTVRQVFHNPTDKKIEAVYVFPLPQDAAVDDMTMQVGERRIVGQIKPREEAREIYEAAKAAGHVASLLDQERPNIFTQSVANIEPGVEVSIEITYVETLKYADGVFEWVFPMVVGPRYIPGGGSAPAPMTPGQDTPQVPDGSKITPPVTPEGTRAGHDISLTVRLDTGMELRDLTSTLHEVTVETTGPGRATVSLKNQAEIPNKDFILRYRLAGDEIADAFLVHQDERGRFFTLVLQPPRRVVPDRLVPRELVFVLDSSGSMSNFPIEVSVR
jgi:Ca-activated chloride channel family protein